MTMWRARVLGPDKKSDMQMLSAPSRSEALRQLMAGGYVALDLQTGPPTVWEILNRPVAVGGKLGIEQQAMVLRQLAVMLEAGVPLEQSLDLVREQYGSSKTGQWLAQVLVQVRGGASLAAALACRPVLPAWTIGVIEAAEQIGGLGPAMADLADRLGTIAKARREIITAMAYPMIVLASSIAAFFLILLIIVPQFEPLFAGREADLPTLTQIIFWMSATVRANGPLLLASTLLSALLLILLPQVVSVAAAMDRHRRFIPGRVMMHRYLAGRVASILGALLKGGIPISRALPLVRDAVGHPGWKAALEQARGAVNEGAMLSAALRQSDLMPVTAIRLVEVGERTGKLAEALERAGGIITETVLARLNRIISLLNPIAILTLGMVVAFLVGGVMLGIFSLGDMTIQ